MSVLKDRGLVADALRVSLAAAHHDPKAGEARVRAAFLLEDLRGLEAARAWVQRAIEEDPEDFELHRGYQHLLRRADRFEEARTYYRAFAQARPGPLARVLLARTESPDAALLLYREAVGADSAGDPLARRSLARLLLDMGRNDESVAEFERVAEADPEYVYYVDDHLRALFRLGRAKDALAVAAKAAEKHPKEWRLAVLYAEVARSVESTPTPQAPAHFIDQWSQKNQNPEMGIWMRGAAGLAIDDALVKKLRLQSDPLVLAGRVMQLAALDPSLAWSQCAQGTPPVLERVTSTALILLAAEFHRAGDPDLADRLLAQVRDVPIPRAALVRYVVEGTEHPEMWRLDGDVRAAVDFVRSRKLSAEGASAAADTLVRAARAREGYEGLVHRCIEAWPPPRPGGATVALVRRPAAAAP